MVAVGGCRPPTAVKPQSYEQLLEIIFTECTSSRRSVWLDDDGCFCSSVIVVPVVVLVVEPAAVVPVVVPDELEDEEDSRPVTVTRWPTCAERSLELPSSFHVDSAAVDIVPCV